MLIKVMEYKITMEYTKNCSTMKNCYIFVKLILNKNREYYIKLK